MPTGAAVTALLFTIGVADRRSPRAQRPGVGVRRCRLADRPARWTYYSAQIFCSVPSSRTFTRTREGRARSALAAALAAGDAPPAAHALARSRAAPADAFRRRRDKT
jgi:hypothetical protein